ncbi:DUF1684 domain-containing protein [Streptomyces sp. NPDC058374]|uniref:DUF1684 domain-containing protein n=1 Tax=Streptomyces sp. NPDC058374 TaxID=3346466 RepID=UPI00364E5009
MAETTGERAAAGSRTAAEEWHRRRTAWLTAPHGPLSATGVHWLDDFPEGRLPAIPGRWTADEDRALVTAAPADGLAVDGRPLDGTARLDADQGAPGKARAGQGGRRFAVLRREGLWAVRAHDPDAGRRRAAPRIALWPDDPAARSTGTFTPYPDTGTARVENADGHHRGLGLGGELALTLGGEAVTLQVTVEAGGGLWAVFADATGAGPDAAAEGGHRFRFLRTAAPAADGSVAVDLNRAELPPCAFSPYFLCPFPPPGNALAAPVRAGERNLAAA